jgi:uncharacterized protein YndB with AHSA1/START domain
MNEIAADREAPVYSRDEVLVGAPPETVWSVISDIAGWPRWNPDVRDARIDGEFATGTSFEWKAGPGTIRSTLKEVDRPRLVGWTGKTMGIPAIHIYRLEEAGDQTRVVLEESWDGVLSRLFRKYFQTTLDKAVTGGLRALKSEAERRAAV